MNDSIQMTSAKVLPFYEKVGYALGDAAANLVWRGALAYLAVFYTDTFGIPAAAAALLILLVRLSDGVTDIVMGMIADRTQTPSGKFRPWVLWSTPVLGLFMVLCFTTPDWGTQSKLVYAYITYIGLTLAYTVNNVPYSALMGVMTPSDQERTSLSGFRFAGAFLGGLLVMGFLPDLVAFFGKGNEQIGYQYTMYVFAALLVILMLITFFTTRERVQPKENDAPLKSELWDLTKNLPVIICPLLAITLFFYFRNLWSFIFFAFVVGGAALVIRKALRADRTNWSASQHDMINLITNKPWLILLLVGFLFMMFNGIKYGVIAYYFKYFVGDYQLAGRYFIALLIISVFGALAVEPLTRWLGKRALFIGSLVLGAFFSSLMFWLPASNVTGIFVMGCVSEFFAAMMPVLFFTMLGDAADYSEWKNGRRATGLVFSAGTFVNKTGGGFAGALVLLVLASYGYDGMVPETADGAIPGILLLMTWIPAAFAVAGALVMLAYPLGTKEMNNIGSELTLRREAIPAS